jgi:hypothetical protein
MKRRKITAVLLASAFALSATAPAFAVPDFGPGSSQKGPQDAGARCHPPGQTTDRAECK